MAFVRAETISSLHEENKALSLELGRFEDMHPFLQLALEMRDEVVSVMSEAEDRGTLEITPGLEIADQAYRNVLLKKVDEARDEVVADYEQLHRNQLYERVITEVRESEGSQILTSVQKRLDTDPELAMELRESAKRELGARALDAVRDSVTDEQRRVINREAKRQIALDRLDVKLALEGRLDLLSSEVEVLLGLGDKMDLYFENEGSKNKLTLEWSEDARNKSGWVFADSDRPIYSTYGVLNLDTPFFVRPATVNVDRTTGDEVVQADILTTDLPFALISNQRGSRNQITRNLLLTNTSHGYSKRPAILRGSDLHTKDIRFFSQAAG